MKRQWWVVGAALVTVLGTAELVRAQQTVNLPCKRVDSNLCQASASTTAQAWSTSNQGMLTGPSDYQNPATVLSATLAHNFAGSLVSWYAMEAIGMAMTTVTCICPLNGDAFVPQVDATINTNASAELKPNPPPSYFRQCDASAYGSGYIDASFRIDANPNYPRIGTPTLRGELYLVASGGPAANAPEGITSIYLSSTCSGASAIAYWNAGMRGFSISHTAPNGQGVVYEFKPGGLNEFYEYTVPTAIGTVHKLYAKATFGCQATASNYNGLVDISMVMWNGLSAACFEVDAPNLNYSP